jgi:hypothetical protein
VQRIRIRSNALSTDSNAANAPSYPSRAVEANPANTIEIAHLMGIGSAATCCRPLAATSAFSGEQRDAEAFRSTSTLAGAADHGSRTVAALGAGDQGRTPSFISKKNVCIAVTSFVLSIA